MFRLDYLIRLSPHPIMIDYRAWEGQIQKIDLKTAMFSFSTHMKESQG